MLDLSRSSESYYKKPCPYYSSGCKDSSPDNGVSCRRRCQTYPEIIYLIDHCGHGDISVCVGNFVVKDRTMKGFTRVEELRMDMENFVKNRKNVYIYSDFMQCGKTTSALRLMYQYFDRICVCNNYTQRGYYVKVQELLRMIEYPQLADKEELKALDSAMRNADIIVWDDIAIRTLSNKEQNYLLSYIDCRVSDTLHPKSNIFVGTLSNKSLQQAVGERLFQRIWVYSEPISFGLKTDPPIEK